MTQGEITVRDIHEFLYRFLRQRDYDQLIAVIESGRDFYFSFELTEKIEDIRNVIIFKKNNRFAIQFVPEGLESRINADSIAPDVVVFVNK